MTQSLIVLKSITYAYKAQRILEQLWIKSAVIRTPGKFNNKGCGYSLVINTNPDRATEALEKEKIPVLQVIHDYRS